MKIEMTRYELSLILELVRDNVSDLWKAICKRRKIGEDATSLERRLDEMDPIYQKLQREFVGN